MDGSMAGRHKGRIHRRPRLCDCLITTSGPRDDRRQQAHCSAYIWDTTGCAADYDNWLTGVSALARPLSAAISSCQTRAPKLPGVARLFESLASPGAGRTRAAEDYLHEVLSAEQASRHESVIRQRLRDARLSEIKALDAFDFTAAEGVSATQIHALARGAWVTAPGNLILAGPIGTGKTHLLTGVARGDAVARASSGGVKRVADAIAAKSPNSVPRKTLKSSSV